MNRDTPDLLEELRGREQAWRVLDDFDEDVPVTPAELDVLQAFLMAAVNAIMTDQKTAADNTPDSEPPQNSGTCQGAHTRVLLSCQPSASPIRSN
jgi:hypothetical protein